MVCKWTQKTSETITDPTHGSTWSIQVTNEDALLVILIDVFIADTLETSIMLNARTFRFI